MRGTSSNDIVKVEGIETGTTNLTALVEGGNGECRVLLRLMPGMDIGPNSATVTIRTSHPVLNTVSVPVTWKTEGDLYAIPEEITVVVKPGATNEAIRYVAIRSRSGKHFSIDAVDAGLPGNVVETSDMPGGKGFLLKVSSVLGNQGTNRPVVLRFDHGIRLTVPIKTFAEPFNSLLEN